jgi:hypothetical protein
VGILLATGGNVRASVREFQQNREIEGN